MDEFKPTHRHYKGGLYRVLRRDYLCGEWPAEKMITWNGYRVFVTDPTQHNELGVIYQGQDGRLWLRPQRMFDEPVDRFRAYVEG